MPSFSAAFAFVQWGIVLPAQLYFVYRSWRNWKESDVDMKEAHETMLRARRHLLELQTLTISLDIDLDADEPPPTVQ